MEYTIGQVVFAKCGRDKGKAFIISEISDEYLYLVDGRLRTLEHPKKKKHKHVQKTNYVKLEIKEKLENGNYILDAEIFKALKEYNCNLQA